ncbi:MAG: hypothetical protein ACR2FH_05760, partial [Caulobacteraceae bacterium]
MWKSLAPAGALAALAIGVAHAAPSQPPPPAPSPVTETLHGVRVTDTWRGMEKLGPATVDWMKAQGRYTRELLGSIGPRAGLLARIANFSASFGPVKSVEVFAGRTFYLEQPPGSDNFNLMVRAADGSARTLVDVGRLRAEHGGAPYAINYFEASPDGARVGVGVSAGGSEAAQLYVYDAATGAQIAGPIDRSDFGGLAWSDDGKTLFFLRLQKTDDPQQKYFNITDQVWDLKGEPREILGAPVTQSAIKVPPVMGAGVSLTPGSDVAVAFVQNGVQNEIEVWTAPAARAAEATAPWRPLATRDDAVTALGARGDDTSLPRHREATTLQVLSVEEGQPPS